MPLKDRALLISITGGIASGKSLVASYLKDKGFTLFNADKVGHEVLKNEDIISLLAKEFGKEIIKDGKIVREKLGEIVFKSKENITKLNAIVHPQIRKDMQTIVDEFEGEILFFEVPLLFEGNLEKGFDYSLLIYCDEATQIQRLKERNNFSEQQALERIKKQMPTSEKIAKSDFQINNNSTIQNLEAKLEGFLQKITQLKKKDVIKITEI